MRKKIKVILSKIVAASLVLSLVSFSKPFSAVNANAATAASPVFYDNFEDGKSNGWSIQKGSWTVKADGTNKTYCKTNNGESRTKAGNLTWTNYALEGKIKVDNFNGNNRAMLCGRYTDGSNYYAASLSNTNGGEVELRKVVKGSDSILKTTKFPLTAGTWYTVKLDMNGSSLNVYVNNSLKLTSADASLAAGAIGLVAFTGNTQYDDITVTNNETPPTPITYPTPTLTPNTTTASAVSVTVTIANFGNAPVKQYKLDDGAWQNYTAPVTVTKNCTLYAQGSDSAGNKSSVGSLVINNITAPVTYPTPTLTPDTTAANASSVTVTIANFGKATVKQYKIDDGSWQNYTAPVVVTTNCTVYAQGSDSTGNKSSIGSLVISNIGTTPSEVRDYDLYVSPSGNDTNKGTINEPLKTLTFAESVVKPGRTIYLRGGVHKYSATITLSRSGSENAPINIFAYSGEKPVLDFSDFKPATEDVRFYARGITLTGDYYHIKGLEICNAPDNGMKLEGSNNTIELCVFHHNGDSGLQIGLIKGAKNDGTKVANNLILNCDSYRNADPATKYENADGFACKLYPGKGNKFYGCRAYENCDDGWDFYMTTYPIVVENCWAWHNGDPSLWGFTSFNGDGNGFKLGGDGEAAPHIIKNCVAFDSPYGAKCGFNDNNNGTGLILYNCTAWACGKNFKLQTQAHVLKNCAAFDPKSGKNFNADISEKATQANNTWLLTNVTADYNDFISTSVNDALASRQADGNLPNNGFAKLKTDSDLIDKGVDVGIPYKGTAPDLGAYEYNGTASVSYPTPTLTPNTTAANVNSVTVTVDNFGTAPVKQYKIDNGSWQDYTAPVAVTQNCTVYAQGSDSKGNKSSIGSLVISNIGEAPLNYPTPSLSPDTTTANVSSVTVTIDNFGTAPVKQYKIGNGTWQDYTAPVVVTQNCTIYAQGSDSKGNKSSLGSLVISNIGAVKPGDVITVKTFDELKTQAASASKGQTIEIAADVLNCTSQLLLDKVDSNITIKAAAGYTPILDFKPFSSTRSGQSNDGDAGIRICGGSYTIKGLIIQKAYDNGILIKPYFDANTKPSEATAGKPDNNTIINCVFRYNGDSGLQVGGSQTLEKANIHVRPNNTHVIGCVSYRNYDKETSGGNADGFAAKLYLGTGTVFSHCVAAENSDDGWDSFGVADSDVTYEDCVAFHSGDPAIFTGDYDKAHNLPEDKDMTIGKPSGNANGFKMGSASSKYGPQTSGIRTLTNCVAIDNFAKGFDENNGAGTINITNSMGLGNVKCNYLLDLMKAGTFVNAQTFPDKKSSAPSGGTLITVSDTAKQAAIRSEIENAISKMRQELRENKIPSYMNFSFWAGSQTPVSYPTPALTPSTTSANVSSVTVTIDNFGTAPVKQYKIDNDGWQNYSTPITVTKNCTVYAQGSDTSGNKSSIGSLVINNIGSVTPPVGYNFVVAKDGSGNYTTVQEAINALSDNNSQWSTIYIKNGTYNEVVTVPATKTFVKLIGESAANTIITFNYCKDTNPAKTTAGSATAFFKGNDFLAQNITFENSFDYNNSKLSNKQAVAAEPMGDRQVFINCRFTGYQDTLYVRAGRQYFKDCYINGHTDFIFGEGTAVFDNCEIYSRYKSGASVSAASTLQATNYGLVFINCKLTADPTLKTDTVWLGRPWHPSDVKNPLKSSAAFLYCNLGAHIKTEGWTKMGSVNPSTERLTEYKNTGAGAVINSTRPQLSDSEAANYTVKNILKGTDNWDASSVK